MDDDTQDFITSQNLLFGLIGRPVEQERLSYIYEKFTELGNISLGVFKLFSNQGQNTIAAISHPMMVQSIENAHIAFHLSLRGYPTQSYAILRPILEIINLIKLFQKDPKEIENWQDAENDYELKKTFTASNVRKKLGKENRDNIFGFISNVGSHATWKMIYNKFEMESRDNHKPLIKTVIGGTHNQNEIVLSNFMTFYVFTQFIIEMINLFIETNKYCNEIENYLDNIRSILTDVIEKYLAKEIEDKKIIEEFGAIIKSLTNFKVGH